MIGNKSFLLKFLVKRPKGAFIFVSGERANREGGRWAVFSPAIPEQHQPGGNGQKTPLFLFHLFLIRCKPVKNKTIFHKLKSWNIQVSY